MDILRKLRGWESTLTQTMNEAAQRVVPPRSREPLEILHAIVATVETRLEPAGRGKYVFPFNHVAIRIVAPTNETRLRFDAVLQSEPTLHERIIEALRSAGCGPAALRVETTYVTEPEADWNGGEFQIDFDRVSALPEEPDPAPPTRVHHSLKLTVLQEAAEKPSYVFTTSRVNLGRLGEVRDSRDRLVRTNHVVLDDHPTVSRQHAHIESEPNLAGFRLYDDRSAHGTSIVRNGTTITVPPGSRGIRLKAGDELALGEARLLVEIEKQS